MRSCIAILRLTWNIDGESIGAPVLGLVIFGTVHNIYSTTKTLTLQTDRSRLYILPDFQRNYNNYGTFTSL